MNHLISLPSYENDPNSRREFDYLQVPNVRHDSTPTHHPSVKAAPSFHAFPLRGPDACSFAQKMKTIVLPY